LLPSHVATFINYTSYTRGINGIMVDVTDATILDEAAVALILADQPEDQAAIQAIFDAIGTDFSFKVGNSNDLDDWTDLTAPNLPAVTVRPGAGNGGSDRITLVWPDNTIQQEWLQATIEAGGDLGLVAEDIFYFGNAIGDSGEGNPVGVATTFISDELGARNNPHTWENAATVEDAYDYNRDARVFISDELVAREHQTTFLTGLKLITAPAPHASTATATDEVHTARIETVEKSRAARLETDPSSPSARIEIYQYTDAALQTSEPNWLPYLWFDEMDLNHDEEEDDLYAATDFLYLMQYIDGAKPT